MGGSWIGGMGRGGWPGGIGRRGFGGGAAGRGGGGAELGGGLLVSTPGPMWLLSCLWEEKGPLKEEKEYRGREWRGREGGKVEREREDKCMVGN